jgi:hypothetical protein
MMRKPKITILLIALVLLAAAPALARDVTLSWTAPDDDRVTGYYVYYGQANPPVPENGGTEIDAGSTTSQEITGLAGGSTYYFAARSYDADGNTSVMSDILEYYVPEEPDTITVDPLGRPGSMQLELHLSFQSGD